MNEYGLQVKIPSASYIYRVSHRVMEGGCQVDHGPRLVTLDGFTMDTYPVTNAQYKKFMDETGYVPKDNANFLRYWTNGMPSDELLTRAVVWVSPTDAKAYAEWRNCRLPTEEQWQFAAGGPQKLKWPWGNEFVENMCNSEEGASPFGVQRMCGNVWEWTTPIIDDGHRQFALLRGGCSYRAAHFWHTDGGPRPTNFHLEFPLLNEGLNRCETVGFRCVGKGAAND